MLSKKRLIDVNATINSIEMDIATYDSVEEVNDDFFTKLKKKG